MSTTNLLDALRIVIENERLASDSYAKAALLITNPGAKQLFEELSKFEQFHFEQLSALETSLDETGDFFNYKGKEFPTPPIFEIKAAQEPNMKSLMKITPTWLSRPKIPRVMKCSVRYLLKRTYIGAFSWMLTGP